MKSGEARKPRRGRAAFPAGAFTVGAEEREAALERIVRAAIAEDLGAGDRTVAALALDRRPAQGVILAKQAGVLSGIDAAARVFAAVDPELQFTPRLSNGAKLEEGSLVGRVRGPVGPMLSAERTALNFLQRLSGVASLTARFVARVDGSGVAILDTRKTTPGLRILEKEAVRHGGGRNHRFGLYDAIMVKENHITAAGGVREALSRVIAHNRVSRPPLEVIVEIDDPALLESALADGVNQILLDNLAPFEVAEAVETIRRYNESRPARERIRVEVSGGVTLENVRDYAIPGVDFISVGALTHSAPALDLSLDLQLDQPVNGRP